MRHAFPFALAVWGILLVTTSGTAHSRVFFGAKIGVPAHVGKMAPRTVIASPSFVTVSRFHGIPPAGFVIPPQRVIRAGIPVIVTRPSATFFPHASFVSPPLLGAVSPFHSIPPAGFVITRQRAIRPGALVMVTRPSGRFFPHTGFVSPPLQGAFPHPVTVPRRGVGPKVIMVETTGSTRHR
jgi:hypothetical protein